MESNQHTIFSAITNIKVSGIAHMEYWSIIETQGAICFVQTGSAMGLGVGTNNILMATSVIGDVIASRKSKKVTEQNLSSVLSNAEQYFFFSKKQMNHIRIKKRLFGGVIIIPSGKEKSWAESGIIKLKLSPKKYRLFLEMLNRLSSSDSAISPINTTQQFNSTGAIAGQPAVRVQKNNFFKVWLPVLIIIFAVASSVYTAINKENYTNGQTKLSDKVYNGETEKMENKQKEIVCTVEEEGCKNNLLANCIPGVMQYPTYQYTIKTKTAYNCVLDFEYIATEGAPNPLDGYQMTCNVPLSVKNLTALDDFFATNEFQGCQGDLKDKIDEQAEDIKIIQEAASSTIGKKSLRDMGSGIYLSVNDCSSDESCANLFLQQCEKGLFTYTDKDNNIYQIGVNNGIPESCAGHVLSLEHSNPRLVGLNAKCVFRGKEINVDTIGAFIDSGFETIDTGETQFFCGGLLTYYLNN